MKLAVNMKLRTIRVIPLLFISIFAITGSINVHRAYATTTISILPALISDTSLGPGSTFQYGVELTGLATSLYGSEYEFLYDPSVVQAQSVDVGGYWSALVSAGGVF